MIQHKPLLRLRVLERVECDRQIDDTRRTNREHGIERGRTYRRAGGAAEALRPHEPADSVVAGTPQTELPSGFAHSSPCRGDRNVVPVERDHERVDPGVAG